MKKKYILFIASLAFPFLLNAQTVPGPLTIKKYDDPINIDAKEDDSQWAKITAQPIGVVFIGNEAIGGSNQSEAIGFSGPSDLTATFKSFYNDTAIYFFFNVIDDVVTQSNIHWIGDKINIYFGLPGYDSTKGASANHSRLFGIRAQVDITPIAESGSSSYGPQYVGGNDINKDGVNYSFAETAQGYVMEVSINKVIALENINYDLDELAFDIDIADNDEPDPAAGKRYRKSWHNDGHINEAWTEMQNLGILDFDYITNITINPIPTIKYGDVFSLNATSTVNTLPIVYKSCDTTMAKIKGNEITARKTGKVKIIISQGTDSIARYINIAKAPLLIKADNKTKHFGDKNPTFTATITGYKNGDDLKIFSSSIKFTCIVYDTLGKYDITPVYADSLTLTNYAISYEKGTLLVTKPDGLSFSTSTIQIFPNPTTDYVNIKSTENARVTIQLLDLTGQILIEKIITDEMLDVQTIPAGIYILKVNNEVFKLIKQ